MGLITSNKMFSAMLAMKELMIPTRPKVKMTTTKSVVNKSLVEILLVFTTAFSGNFASPFYGPGRWRPGPL
jgi:hypothetical protein